MSRVLSATDISARALRAIGQYPITDSAPDGEQLREAMTWLDMLMAETAGTERLFSRVTPATLSFPITNGTQSYDFYATLGTQLPTDRIEFILDCWLEDGNGNRFGIEIVDHRKFEAVERPAEIGQPRWINIDRAELPTATQTLRIFPTPDVTDPTAWSLKILAQRYAPNVAPGGVTGTQPQSAVMHDFGQAWQRWLVLQLAHDLGSGPVVKLPQEGLANFKASALEAKTRLLAFKNREDETTPPVCDSNDVDDVCRDGARFSGSDYGNRRGW